MDVRATCSSRKVSETYCRKNVEGEANCSRRKMIETNCPTFTLSRHARSCPHATLTLLMVLMMLLTAFMVLLVTLVNKERTKK